MLRVRLSTASAPVSDQRLLFGDGRGDARAIRHPQVGRPPAARRVHAGAAAGAQRHRRVRERDAGGRHRAAVSRPRGVRATRRRPRALRARHLRRVQHRVPHLLPLSRLAVHRDPRRRAARVHCAPRRLVLHRRRACGRREERPPPADQQHLPGLLAAEPRQPEH